jgi:hypothetical protein
MKVKSAMIDAYGKWRVGAKPFDVAKHIVQTIDSMPWENGDKRQYAVETLRTTLAAMGLSLANYLLNAAVEIAVDWLRQKLK